MTPWTTLAADVRSAVLGDGVVDAVRGGGQTIALQLRVNTIRGLHVLTPLRNVTMLQHGETRYSMVKRATARQDTLLHGKTR